MLLREERSLDSSDTPSPSRVVSEPYALTRYEPYVTRGGALLEGLAASQLAVLALSATPALAPAINAATRTLGRAHVQAGRITARIMISGSSSERLVADGVPERHDDLAMG